MKNDRLQIWDLLAVCVFIAVIGAHAQFVIEDTRLPRDMGLYYTRLPIYIEGIAQWGTAKHIIWDAAISPMGWYNLLLAWALAVFGVKSWVFQSFDVLWVSMILGFSGLIARRLGGPAAGLSAIALVAATPLTVVTGRLGWIHIPETALALWAVWIWMRDQELARIRTLVGLGVLGAMTITIRQTGFIWIAPLVPAMIWGFWRSGGGLASAPWRKLGGLLAVWAFSFIPVILGLRFYIEAKLAARDRYAADVPSLAEHLVAQIGMFPLITIGLGLAGFVVLGRKSLRPVALTLAAWAAAPLLLVGLFQAGLDNFNPLAPALAILGAWGLAVAAGPLALLPLAGWLAFYMPQFYPSQSVEDALGHVPGLNMGTKGPDVNNYYRQYQRFGKREIVQLFRATCPRGKRKRCNILIDQGLFYPYVEDYGQLELFFLDDDRIRIYNLEQYERLGEAKDWAALAHYNCGMEKDKSWRDRYPESTAALETAMQNNDLQPAWSKMVNDECEFIWMTPGGELVAPQSLPMLGYQWAGGAVSGDGQRQFRTARRPGDEPEGLPGSGAPGGDEVEFVAPLAPTPDPFKPADYVPSAEELEREGGG